jgi:hypothetical protein
LAASFFAPGPLSELSAAKGSAAGAVPRFHPQPLEAAQAAPDLSTSIAGLTIGPFTETNSKEKH